MLRKATTAVRALALGATERLDIQFARYLVAGGIATVFDFGTLILLTSGVGLHYLLSNACGFTVGVIANYLLSVYWVFSYRRLRSKRAEFAIFALIGIGGLGVSELCMYAGVDMVGLHYSLAKIVATGCALAWNFSVRKLMLFRRQERDPERQAEGWSRSHSP